MIKREYIQGEYFLYENKLPHIEEAIYYLRDKIEREEATVFFRQAYEKGEAQFEDQNGHNFTINYDSDNSFYSITVRD